MFEDRHENVRPGDRWRAPCLAWALADARIRTRHLGAQMAGGPPVAWDDIAHLGLTAEDVASSDFPSVHGVAVMNAMRGKLGRIPGTESNIYGVGGLCELTTVSEQGVASRFLCHYPDQLGKPVDPAQQALQ